MKELENMLSCEYKSENTSTNSSIVKFPTIEYFESDVYLEEVLQSHNKMFQGLNRIFFHCNKAVFFKRYFKIKFAKMF